MKRTDQRAAKAQTRKQQAKAKRRADRQRNGRNWRNG